MSRPKCPSCGSRDTLAIVFGLVGADVGLRAERGEIVLGGCIVAEGNLQGWRHCTVCEHEFHAATGQSLVEAYGGWDRREPPGGPSPAPTS